MNPPTAAAPSTADVLLTPSERVFLDAHRYARRVRPRRRTNLARVVPALVCFLISGALLWLIVAELSEAAPASAPPAGMLVPLLMILVPAAVGAVLLWRAREEDLSELAETVASGEPVSAPELVVGALRAAFLALEDAGALRIEMDPDAAGALRIVPLAADSPFPPDTLEGRLPVARARSVEDAVHTWLGDDSRWPWRRAARQLEILAVIRGLARELPGRGKRRVVPVPVDLRPDPTAVDRLLVACEKERPDIWQGMEVAAAAAVRRRARVVRRDDHVYEPDPWMDEAAQVREALAPGIRAGAHVANVVFGAVGAALWALYFAGTLDPVGTVHLVWGAGSLVFFGLASLPRGPLSGVLPWVRRAVHARDRDFIDGPLTPGWRGVTLALVAPAVAALGSAGTSGFSLRWFVPMALLVGLLGAAHALRSRTRMAIQAHVTGRRSGEAGLASAPALPREVARPGEAPGPGEVSPETPSAVEGAAPPFPIDALGPLDLPAPSTAARRRIEEVDGRGPELRRIYRRATIVLAAGNLALALAVGFRSPASPDFPGFVITLTVVTALILKTRSEWESMRRTLGDDLDRLAAKRMGSYARKLRRHVRSPLPEGLRGLAWVWLLLSFLRIRVYLDVGGPVGWGAAGLETVLAAGCFFWLRSRLAEHARRFPERPPFDLLALRVFRSPYLDDFLDLTDLWQWLGTRQRLDGPDTLASDGRDLLNFVSGRIDDSVVDDEDELERALSELGTVPDALRRYPVNTIRCADRTWRRAVERLLDRADVVVVDLSALSPENQGVAWELGSLAERVAWRRVVILVHASTDRETFARVMAGAAARVTPDSPNWGAGAGPLVVEAGGAAARDESESVAAWRRRIDKRVDQERLVGLLLDAAGVG